MFLQSSLVFYFDVKDSAFVNSTHTPKRAVGFRPKFRGADGMPTTEPFLEARVNMKDLGVQPTEFVKLTAELIVRTSVHHVA